MNNYSGYTSMQPGATQPNTVAPQAPNPYGSTNPYAGIPNTSVNPMQPNTVAPQAPMPQPMQPPMQPRKRALPTWPRI